MRPAVELSPSQILRSRLTSNRGQISIVASTRFPRGVATVSSDERRADGHRIGRSDGVRSRISNEPTSFELQLGSDFTGNRGEESRSDPTSHGDPWLEVDGLLDWEPYDGAGAPEAEGWKGANPVPRPRRAEFFEVLDLRGLRSPSCPDPNRRR